MLSQVGDVSHPDLIPRGRMESLLQPVLSHNGGLATIPAGSPTLADLSRDPGKRGRACEAVLRDLLGLVTQIGRQFAIAIDLAAIGLSLPDQLSLARFLQRAVA